MTVELFFPGDAEWTDVSHLVIYKSQELNRRLMNRKRKSVVDTYSFSLKYEATINEKIYAAAGRILIQVSDGETPEFTGSIAPALEQTKGQIVREISLEAVDNSWLLDESLDESFQYPSTVGGTPFKILDTADTDHSIVHKLLEMAGYSIPAAIAAGCPDITDTVLHISGTKGDESYRDIIDSVLFEYGYVFTFNGAGQFTVYQWDKDVVTPSSTLTGQFGTTSGIRIKKIEREYDGYKTEWAETEIEENALLYRENLPISSSGGAISYPGKAVGAGDYFPTDGDIQDIYQDFKTNWLDKPYLSRETRLENKDLSLIAASNWVPSFDADEDFIISSQDYEAHRGKVLFQNTGAGTENIYFFEIHGKALYRAARRYATVPENAKRPEEYTSLHIYDESRAVRFSTAMSRLAVFGNFEYSFESRRADLEYAVGEIIQITQADPQIDTTVVILEKRKNPDLPMVAYLAQGITAYVAETVTQTGSHHTPTYQQSSELKAEILESIDEGFTAPSGGDMTPEKPLLLATGAFEYIKLACNRQVNLRWIKAYRWRVTDDPGCLADPDAVTWYGLKQDGTDWKDTSVTYSELSPLEELNHVNIQPVDLSYLCEITSGSPVITLDDTSKLDPGDEVTGSAVPVGATILSIDSGTQITISTNATSSGEVDLVFGGGTKKMGRRLFYQVRRVTVKNDFSDWSDVAEATTTLVKGTSVGIHELDVNNLVAGILQALFAAIRELAAGYDGSGSYSNPDVGDYSLMIKDAQIYLQQYLGETDGGGNPVWSNINKLLLGIMLTTGQLLPMIGCHGVIHPDADKSDLEILLPPGAHYFDYEADYSSQDGLSPYATANPERSAVWKETGTYSLGGSSYGDPGLLYYDLLSEGVSYSEVIGIGTTIYITEVPSYSNQRINIVDRGRWVDDNTGVRLSLNIAFIGDHTVYFEAVLEEYVSTVLQQRKYTTGAYHTYETVVNKAIKSASVFDPINNKLHMCVDGVWDEYPEDTIPLTISGTITQDRLSFQVANHWNHPSTTGYLTFYIDNSITSFGAQTFDYYKKHYLDGGSWQGGHNYADQIIKAASGGHVTQIGKECYPFKVIDEKGDMGFLMTGTGGIGITRTNPHDNSGMLYVGNDGSLSHYIAGTVKNKRRSDNVLEVRGDVYNYYDVAQYYNSNLVNEGIIRIICANIGNIMLDCEITIFGYEGLQKVYFKGYTYTGSSNWYSPKAIISQVGYSGSTYGGVVAKKRDSDGRREIWIGEPTAAWGNYPKVTVDRVSVGYGRSAGCIGDWSIVIEGSGSVPGGYTTSTTTNHIL